MQTTLKDIEVIVVNDGSNDQSLAECYRLQEIDKRIIIINQDNQGVSKARNVGKQNATGDYIIFIDADDELDCRMLEKRWIRDRNGAGRCEKGWLHVAAAGRLRMMEKNVV